MERSTMATLASHQRCCQHSTKLIDNSDRRTLFIPQTDDSRTTEWQTLSTNAYMAL